MATISVEDIKRLRELTGAGMSDCKQALTDADGDLDKAVEALRIKGAKDVGKRATRTAVNGLVAARLAGTDAGVLIEVNCETDFVAKTEAFQALGSALADQALATRPADVAAFLAQPSTADATKSVQQVVEEANAALGEKVEVRRLAVLAGGYIHPYLHKTSPDLPPTVGVIVQLSEPAPELAKDLAQHIAAMAPKYVGREDVPADVVEAERRIAEQTAREEGKPEQALPRIVEGRVNGYFKDFVLVEQTFVKDNKKAVKSLLADAGVTVIGFARFRVGQD